MRAYKVFCCWNTLSRWAMAFARSGFRRRSTNSSYFRTFSCRTSAAAMALAVFPERLDSSGVLGFRFWAAAAPKPSVSGGGVETSVRRRRTEERATRRQQAGRGGERAVESRPPRRGFIPFGGQDRSCIVQEAACIESHLGSRWPIKNCVYNLHINSCVKSIDNIH
jgi:hypothetical protein